MRLINATHNQDEKNSPEIVAIPSISTAKLNNSKRYRVLRAPQVVVNLVDNKTDRVYCQTLNTRITKKTSIHIDDISCRLHHSFISFINRT
jgi:hypothetical protein